MQLHVTELTTVTVFYSKLLTKFDFSSADTHGDRGLPYPDAGEKGRTENKARNKSERGRHEEKQRDGMGQDRH